MYTLPDFTTQDSASYKASIDAALAWLATRHVVAGGTANALTATFDPAFTALADGDRISVRATAANTSATPTLNADGLGDTTIVLVGGSSVPAGAIQADHDLQLIYNATLGKWVLLNPAYLFAVGIGHYIEAQTDLTGAEEPPKTHFIRLAAGLTGVGGYNEGKLITESVSGSAPLIDATAVIDDAGSPMNGQTVELVETSRHFFRPGSPGTREDSALGAHQHGLDLRTDNSALSAHSAGNHAPQGIISGGSFGSMSRNGGTDETGETETRPRNIGVAVYMRIK